MQIKKSKNTTAHASHLINVYNFLKEIKPNITNVEVLENQPLFFGRKINGVKIIVTTANNGKYSFVCPDKTDYFNNVCELLNLNEQKKEIKKIEEIGRASCRERV